MSLLMQALKKAERAKQSHASDEEPAKPSEAFDQVLELAPQVTVPQEPLSLSPQESAPVEPTLEYMPEPPPAEDPVPPRRPRNAAPPPQSAPPRPRPGRAAAPLMTARAIRLAALGGLGLIVLALGGYMYWHEMYGPGSSRGLPPVPMPGQNLPAAVAPAAVVAAAPDGAAAGPAMPGYAQPPSGVLPPPAVASGAAGPAGPMAADHPPPSSRDQMPPDFYNPDGTPANNPPPPSPFQPTPGATVARAPAELPPAAPVEAPAAAAAAAAPTPAPAPAPRARSAAPAEKTDIRVARASKPEQVNPSLTSGYSAVQRGDLAGARQSYQSVLRQEPNNRDALLGMAAVAVREGQGEQAAGIYARLLEIDPNDTDAMAGLASVRTGDAGQAESRLRRSLERDPEAGSVLFALGNLYARQGRWPEAQQHYFRAYSSTPTNADYAFNLAVGLDRLNQSALALTYYQRALELGAAGPVGFERAAVAQRVRELSGR